MPKKIQGGTKGGFKSLFNFKGELSKCSKSSGATKNAFNF